MLAGGNSQTKETYAPLCKQSYPVLGEQEQTFTFISSRIFGDGRISEDWRTVVTNHTYKVDRFSNVQNLKS